VVPQGLIVSLSFFPFGDFRSLFLEIFLVVVLRPFSLGFGGEYMHETVVVLFHVISLPNL
jgi:hypothetical protein